MEKYIKHKINEAFIDKNGNLGGVGGDLSNDNEFLTFIKKSLNNSDELDEDVYIDLSDNQKKIYRNEVLKYGGVLFCNTRNEQLIIDLRDYDYDKLYKRTLQWIDTYLNNNQNEFPTNELFIEKIDEIFQGLIINKLINSRQKNIEIPKQVYLSFDKNIKDLINKNRIFTLTN
jgi:hypothetical protein